MKVLHVSAYYAPAFVYGGPPRSIHALCRALRQHGLDLQVFTTDANGREALPRDVTADSVYEGVPVRYFPRTFPPSPIGSRALATALRREVQRYDLVHIHGLWNRAVWSAARAAARAGIPYVLSPRGMLDPAARAHHGWRKRAMWTLIESRVVRGADLLHATSERERDSILATDPRAPVIVIPNGVDVEPPSQHTRDARLIVFLGRLHPIKRLDLLIDGFAAARERRPTLRLAIAGPDECALRSALTARAGRHAAAITWVGAVDGVQRQALLGHAAALVMCSDAESFGMSVLEAMAAAVPVIVTKTCPWSDVQRHQAGFWIEQTADALADAMTHIADNPNDARVMGERGRALAEARYQWSAIARAFVSQYGTVRAHPASAAALSLSS